MHRSENPFPMQGPGASLFVGAGPGFRKEKKKQSKEDRDRQKQEEKKRRRLEKALATSAAIRLELEKKKQRKREEDQRLDEEGAALAEAVALHVLLDEDTDRVTHLETYAELGFEGLSMLSGSDQTCVRTDRSETYLSSPEPFDCMLSSGLEYPRGLTYAFINGTGNKDPLHSLTWQGGFMHRLNQNAKVAVRLDYENPTAWINNGWEQSSHLCSDRVSSPVASLNVASLNTPFKPTRVQSVGEQKVYSIDDGQQLLDTIVLKSLDRR